MSEQVEQSATAVANEPITAPSSFDITAVADVEGRITAIMEAGGGVVIDVGAVEKVDTAGVQLLHFTRLECARRGIDFELVGDCAPLGATAAQLGMKDMIGLR